MKCNLLTKNLKCLFENKVQINFNEAFIENYFEKIFFLIPNFAAYILAYNYLAR